MFKRVLVKGNRPLERVSFGRYLTTRANCDTPVSASENSPKEETPPAAEQDANFWFKPFRLTQNEAKYIAHAHHFKNRYWPPKVDIVSCSPLYVPFYLFRIETLTRIEVDLPEKPPLLPFAFLRGQMKRVTHILKHTYDGQEQGEPSMQVYGSRELNRSLMYRLKRKDGWNRFAGMSDASQSRPAPLPDSLMASVERQAFNMLPSTAINFFIEPFIDERERKRAEMFLKQRYGKRMMGCNPMITTSLSKFNIKQVYFPCYMFRVRHLQDEFITLVDGTHGQVSGQRFINHVPFSSTVSALGALFAYLQYPAGGFSWTSWYVAMLTSSLVPAYLTSVFLRGFPAAQSMLAEGQNAIFEGLHTTAVAKRPFNKDQSMIWSWKDFQGIAERWHEWQEHECRQKQAEQWTDYQTYMKHFDKSNPSWAAQERIAFEAPKHPDSLGYYEVLGLSGREAIATQEEISEAFKRLAKLYHPDRISRVEDKERTVSLFHHASQAYSVLRNVKKREAYDKSGSYEIMNDT